MSNEYNQNQRELKIQLQDKMINQYVCQTCLNCSNFNKDETCELYKAKPPAYIIVSGCKDYLQDIPF